MKHSTARRSRTAFGLAAVFGLLAAGCGSDDDDNTGDSPPPTAGSTDPTAAPPTDPPATTDAAAPTGTTGDEGPEPTDPAAADRPEGPTWDMDAANAELIEVVGEYPVADGETTQGVTEGEISVACVVAATTAGVPTYGDGYCAGAQARFDRAKAEGTLPYDLNIVFESDTGGDPAKTVTDLTEAIFDEQVFGAIVSNSGVLPSNPLEDEHIPYFGDFAPCGQDTVFGFNITFGILQCPAVSAETNGEWTTYTDSIQTAFSELLGLGLDELKYAAIGSSTPGLVAYQDNFVAQFEEQGIDVVYSENPLPATSGEAVDLNPYAIPVIESDPDIVGIFSLDPLLTARLFGALKDAGYEGKASLQVLSSMLENPQTAEQLDGGSGTAAGWGYPDGSDAWTIIADDAMAVGAPVPVQNGFFRGWGAADQMVTGLTDFLATGQTLTTENFVNFLNDGWTYPGFGNVVAPTIYPYGKYGPAPCAALSEVNAAEQREDPAQDLACGQVFFKKL